MNRNSKAAKISSQRTMAGSPIPRWKESFEVMVLPF
jgi:hypothetical protein